MYSSIKGEYIKGEQTNISSQNSSILISSNKIISLISTRYALHKNL